MKEEDRKTITAYEAFDQLRMKIRRIMEAYREGGNGYLLYMWLDELMSRADKWEIEE